MSIQECNVCYRVINNENSAYCLNHADNVQCGIAHIFDRACAELIEQIMSCPFCRSNNFYVHPPLGPPKAESL